MLDFCHSIGLGLFHIVEEIVSRGGGVDLKQTGYSEIKIPAIRSEYYTVYVIQVRIISIFCNIFMEMFMG